jgi:uroporphyrinogen-III synthase
VAGRRILVTRARDEAERWAKQLSALGATPVVFPCLVCEPIEDVATATTLRSALSKAQWLLVTSPRAAAAIARLLAGVPAVGVRIAVVGPSSERAAVALLGRADLVAPRATSAALGAALGELLEHEGVTATSHVVIAGAVGGRDDAEDALVSRGVSVTRVDVYRTLPSPPVELRRDFSAFGIDDVLLASPSAVTGLLNTAVIPFGARMITIGPTTTAAATAAGLSVSAEARQPTFEGLLEALS